MGAVAVTDDEFRAEVLEADRPVLVDFWAEWCAPCRIIGPILDKVADEHSDQLTVRKLNVDDNPVTPEQVGVRSIPTLMVFRDGSPEKVIVGAKGRKALLAELADYIGDE